MGGGGGGGGEGVKNKRQIQSSCHVEEFVVVFKGCRYSPVILNIRTN